MRRTLLILGLVSVCGLWLVSSVTRAASLVSFEVKPDGSTLPPGDLITVTVLFAPQEETVDLSIRAFLRRTDVEVIDNTLPPPQLVKSKSETRRDEDGFYLSTSQLERADGAATAEATLVVEYADLNVPIGQYDLAYELQVSRDERTLFSAVSKWAALDVTAEPRAVDFEQTVEELVPYTVMEEILIPDTAVPTGFRLEQVEKIEYLTVLKTSTQYVDNPPMIAGGFRRTQTYSHVDGPGDDFETEIPDENLSGAEHQAWVPKPKVRIHFATNRNVVNPQAQSMDRYGDRLAHQLSYGTLLVNIPVANHELGKLELPGWFEREDPKEHFIIESLAGLSEAGFRDLIRSRLAGERNDVLLFVHGYNNSMKFAALRLAQVQHDIRFAGPTVLFSWPSRGKVGAYRDDETASAGSVSAFVLMMRQLLQARAQADQPGRIHIIAHSMGNRVLLAGLAEIARDNPPPAGAIGHIILAAPDVDHQQFLFDFPQAAPLAQTITLYFCKEDTALRMSQKLNDAVRIGQLLTPVPPLINVDAAKANTSILGHDYFAARSPLLIDLEMALVLGYPPSKRPTLRAAELQGINYWVFP